MLTGLRRERRFKNSTVNYFVCNEVPETFKKIKKEIDEESSETWTILGILSSLRD